MLNSNTSYASYLLRFWQVQNDQQATWVASVQSTATGERRMFPSVAALLEFLQAEIGGLKPTGDVTPQERAETIRAPE